MEFRSISKIGLSKEDQEPALQKRFQETESEIAASIQDGQMLVCEIPQFRWKHLMQKLVEKCKKISCGACHSQSTTKVKRKNVSQKEAILGISRRGSESVPTDANFEHCIQDIYKIYRFARTA